MHFVVSQLQCEYLQFVEATFCTVFMSQGQQKPVEGSVIFVLVYFFVFVFVNEFIIFSFFDIFVFVFVNENHTAFSVMLYSVSQTK